MPTSLGARGVITNKKCLGFDLNNWLNSLRQKTVSLRQKTDRLNSLLGYFSKNDENTEWVSD